MSKRTRALKQRIHRAAAESPAAPVANYFGAVDYAGNDTSRGHIWWPFAKSKDHLRGFSRTEAIRISQWATSKMGAARMATRGLARRVGVVTLAANTKDEKFNEEHAEWWNAMYVKRAGNYDVSGKFTSEGFVHNAMFCTFRDGDIGLAHVTGESGEPLAMAIESALISGGKGEGWTDGVRIGPQNQHLAYHINPENRDGGDGTVIAAGDMVLLANYETHASGRGAPALLATLDRVRDLREVDNAAIKAAKIQALIAFYVKRQLGATSDPIGSFGGKQRKDNMAASGTQTTAAYGAPSVVPRRVNEVFDDAEMADFPPGTEPGVLNSGQDYSAQTPLKEDIYRQIAWGAGVDPRNLLTLDGMTGPDIRRLLSDFQKWREYWQAAQLNFLTIDYLRRTEWAIRTRQIRRPSDPHWYAFVEHYPAAATIDAGRDAAAQDKRLVNCTSNLQIEYGEMGMGWRGPVKQNLIERAYKKTEGAALGLTTEEIFGHDAAPDTDKPAAALAAEVADLKSSLQLIMDKLGVSV